MFRHVHKRNAPDSILEIRCKSTAFRGTKSETIRVLSDFFLLGYLKQLIKNIIVFVGRFEVI